MSWKCFLLGHKDPVIWNAIEDAGVIFGKLNCSKYELFEKWRTYPRGCMRCGKDLKPATPITNNSKGI